MLRLKSIQVLLVNLFSQKSPKGLGVNSDYSQHGFLQGGFFDFSENSQILKRNGIKGYESHIGVVLPYSCSLIRPHTQKKYIDVIFGQPIPEEKINNNHLHGKSPYTLIMNIEGLGYYRFVIEDREFISFSCLCSIKGSGQLSADANLVLTAWVAKYFRRRALPDVFMGRVKKGYGKLFDLVSKKHKSANNGDLYRSIDGVYIKLKPPFEELTAGEDYQFELLFLVKPSDYHNWEGGADELVRNKINQIFKDADGARLTDVIIESMDAYTISDLDGFDLIDMDYISNREKESLAES